MGQVINANAATDDILADVETTYARATARGGQWQTLATERLDAVRNVIAKIRSRLTGLESQVVQLSAVVDAQDKHSDRFIGQLSDTVWNAIGRPSFDPNYDVVFPGGIAYYTDGANEEQPDRMDLLAYLLELNMIPGLAADTVTTLVKETREESAAYRKAVEPYAQVRREYQQLLRAKTAVAHSARMQLAHLKRLYKTAGFTEADIHSVIPDRPRSAKKSATTPSAPSPVNPARTSADDKDIAEPAN